MEKQTRYILERYKGPTTRYTCPQCKSKKDFTKYIDTITQQYVHADVGKCNRECKCGYHYTPKQFFSDNNIAGTSSVIDKKKELVLPPSTIPWSLVNKSFSNQYSNNFLEFITERFGTTVAKDVSAKYHIGTAKKWTGATVFWQVNINNHVRAGKIILLNRSTCKRIKKKITWVHSELHITNFNLKQCYFGEHLLTKYPTRTVGIVESEKTAVIASIHYPNLIWLSTGGLNNISYEKFEVLRNRKIVLFPDAGCYEKWNMDIRRISHITNSQVKISDLIEKSATPVERTNGYDLADYLLKT